MLDPTTGNSIAADAKCDTGTVLTSSDRYLVISVSDDSFPVDDSYTSLYLDIQGIYPVTNNGKIGHDKFEFDTNNGDKTMTNGSNINVCACAYIAASTGASVEIMTAHSISSVPSNDPSTSPSKPPEGVCMLGAGSTRGEAT